MANAKEVWVNERKNAVATVVTSIQTTAFCFCYFDGENWERESFSADVVAMQYGWRKEIEADGKPAISAGDIWLVQLNGSGLVHQAFTCMDSIGPLFFILSDGRRREVTQCSLMSRIFPAVKA